MSRIDGGLHGGHSDIPSEGTGLIHTCRTTYDSCTIRLELETSHPNPALYVRFEGPSTILAPRSAQACSNTTAMQVSGGFRRLYCISFQAFEAGKHRVLVREEYSSRSEALRDYEENASNPSFLGRVIYDDTFNILQDSKKRTPKTIIGTQARNRSRDGFWFRPNNLVGKTPEWKSHNSRELDGFLQCPSFFSPFAVMTAINSYFQKSMDIKQAHTGLYEGLPLWDVEGQIDALLDKAKTDLGIRLQGSDRPNIQRLAKASLREAWTAPSALYRWVPSREAKQCDSEAEAAQSDPDQNLDNSDHLNLFLSAPLKADVEACLRTKSPIVFATDSIGRYIYHYLVCGLGLEFDRSSQPPVCNFAKTADGEISIQHVPSTGLTTSKKRKPNVLETVKILSERTTPTGLLVLNPGLWDANYGSVPQYKESLGRMVEEVKKGITDGKFKQVVFLGTTDVQPALYPDLATNAGKQFLNKPRVRELNRIQKKVFAPHSRSCGGGESKFAGQDLVLVDLWNMTRSREDVPLIPNDMRHYGPSVVHEMALLLLAAVCPAAAGRHKSS